MTNKNIFLIIIFFCLGLLIGGGIGYIYCPKKEYDTGESVPIPDEIFMRAGEVTKIEGNIISLKAKVLGAQIDPETGQVPTETLKVSVSSHTQFTTIEDPESSLPTEVGFEDIKVGSLLYVLSSDNIRQRKEFLAKEITIL